MIRVGFGYDVHRLVEGRDLWLGGIRIDHVKGVLGHSDADVLLHAVCDAILGALALGDIGYHFPDTDDKWKGADSKELLKAVVKLISDKGWKVNNLDSTLVLEKPRIMPHVMQMRSVIADLLQISVDDVSIKATTNEKMGFVGREEGVCAYAVVSLVRK